MQQEDIQTKKIYVSERIAIRKELYKMAAEEVGLKQLWQFKDTQAKEKSVVVASLDAQMLESHDVTRSRLYAVAQNDTVMGKLAALKLGMWSYLPMGYACFALVCSCFYIKYISFLLSL